MQILLLTGVRRAAIGVERPALSLCGVPSRRSRRRWLGRARLGVATVADAVDLYGAGLYGKAVTLDGVEPLGDRGWLLFLDAAAGHADQVVVLRGGAGAEGDAVGAVEFMQSAIIAQHV